MCSTFFPSVKLSFKAHPGFAFLSWITLYLSSLYRLPSFNHSSWGQELGFIHLCGHSAQNTILNTAWKESTWLKNYGSLVANTSTFPTWRWATTSLTTELGTLTTFQSLQRPSLLLEPPRVLSIGTIPRASCTEPFGQKGFPWGRRTHVVLRC